MGKEAASKTNDAAGDGTTTSTLLAQMITKTGMKNIAAGANPMLVKKGIEKAVAAVVDELKKNAKPIKNKEEVFNIWQSTIGEIWPISSNNFNERISTGNNFIVRLDDQMIYIPPSRWFIFDTLPVRHHTPGV